MEILPSLPWNWKIHLLTNISLALCELYLSLTALVLRVMPHMQLYETTERDIRYDHDMFVPVTDPGSKGVRVIVKIE